ncbi:TerD family protein [Clostridium disporicum]|uniref:TerD family protein n=1 Tax=Clostridium disporicum TaxID=84024 RepID=UPI0034A380BE
MGINLGSIATTPQNIKETYQLPEGVEKVDRGQAGGLSLNLSKGVSLDLTKALPTLNNVKVGLGWDANHTQAVDLDVFALLLHNGKIHDASDVIFFNQKDTGKGVRLNEDNRNGVGEGDDETMAVLLSNVPKDVTSIIFFVNVYDAETKRQNFGMVKNAYIRLINEDTGKEEAIYVLNEQGGLYTAFKFAELERNASGWSFKTLGEGTHGNVQTIVNQYL